MPGARAVLALAALGGAGTMVVELAAVRLLAPWFGSSQSVWTNVIGVILLALALGYLVGARLARGRAPLALLGRALLGAGALAAFLPALSGPAAAMFLPEQLALDEAVALVVWGSLATSLLLFLVPAVMLGMVAPLATEAVERIREGGAGDAGGRVLCASTLGSLAGVFGTTHVLVPRLGLTGTFVLAALVLVTAGAGALLLERRRSPALLLAFAPLGALVLGPGKSPGLPTDWTLLAAKESAYQSVRVVEDSTREAPMRHLQVNEAFDSFQSVWQPHVGFLPSGYYYNLFALPLYWTKSGRQVVAVLGLGAGTAWRVIDGAKPEGTEVQFVGVELDPVVVELAEEHMDLERGAHREIHAGVDARVALRLLKEPVDLMILDCYANQIEIPPHLATVEFFREVRGRLRDDGWLAMNIGGFGFDDPLLQAIAATTATAFDGQALVVRVPESRNFVVFARNGDQPLLVDGLELPSGLPRELFAPLSLPGAYRLVDADAADVLRDDHAPLEHLQMESVAMARELLTGVPR